MTRESTKPTVLVTGGSRGIGREIALHFGRSGWRVGVHYHERTQEAVATADLILMQGGEGKIWQADVRDYQAVLAMMEDFVRWWGRFDVLVCNAGTASSGLVVRLPHHAWTSCLDVNLTGVFHCFKSAGRLMVEQQGGAIILIGSFSADHGNSGQAGYAASKAGAIGLLKTAAREWAPYNVRVNAVLPGWHETELAGPHAWDAKTYSSYLLDHPPDLSSVARSVFHLALLSDISGQVWNLDSRIP